MSRRHGDRAVMVAARMGRVAVVSIALFALLASVVLGGGRYYWCAPMQAVMSRPCCDHDSARRNDHAPAVDALVDCCEARSLATVPTAISSAASSDLPPVILSLRLTFATIDATRSTRDASPFALLDVRRTGPPPPLQRSMVFLI